MEETKLENVQNKIKQLINDYEYYRHKDIDLTKAAHILKQIHIEKQNLQNANFLFNENFRFLERYPEYSDNKFHQKIYNKKEFRKNKYQKVDYNKTFDEIANNECKQKSFELTNNQKFLKNFMSMNTPYNSLLLYHGLGVGKTCSAISIAEQFINYFKKPVLVLAPKGLHENFRNQIYDGKSCTSKKYESFVNNIHIKDQNTIKKEIQKYIKKRYKFLGFVSFSKYISKLELSSQRRFPGNKVKQELDFNQKVQREFSDRVIIIDEVHNTRTDEIQKANKKEDDDGVVTNGKETPIQIEKILSIANNVKLILLSATPMFNDTTEIVTIINFMLANDKKTLLKKSDVFNKDKQITENGINILARSLKGYVSFMKAQNPYSFPFRLYPSINNDRNLLYNNKMYLPKYDMFDQKIPSDKTIDFLLDKIVVNDLTDLQKNVFNYLVHIDDENEEKKNNVNQELQLSNICFPSKSDNIKNSIGVNGFTNCFNYSNGKYKYKPFCIDFLSPNNIEKYSLKFKQIIDYILNSQGIVFVYSMFLQSTLIPLAIALEHHGFTKRNGEKLCTNATVFDQVSFDKINKPKYTMITPNQSLNLNKDTEVRYINSDQNKYGEQVKVILGTQSASEGLDLKNIREIHIIEPWFHLNKIEQVTGRGIRKCSHIMLPPKDRNVTLFLHASINKENPKKESIDIRTYRIAEQKKKNIDIVEKLLIETSIDCSLNKTRFFFPKSPDRTLEIETSQRNQIKNYMYGDNDDSFMKNIKCDPKINKNEAVDDSTFMFSMYDDDIGPYLTEIAKLFKIKPIMRFDTIVTKLKNSSMLSSIDLDVVKIALEYMIKNRYPIINENGYNGYIVYYSDKYMFNPNDASDTLLTKQERYNYKPRIINKVKIGKENLDGKNSENTVEQTVMLNSNLNFSIIHDILSKAAKEKENFKRDFKLDFPIRIFVDHIVDFLQFDDMKKLVITIVYNVNNMDDNSLLLYDSLYEGKIIFKLPNMDFIFRNIYSFKNPIEIRKMLPTDMDTLKMLRSSSKTMKEFFDAKSTSDDNNYFVIKNGLFARPTHEILSEISQNSKIDENIDLKRVLGYVSLPSTKYGESKFKITEQADTSDGTICETFGKKEDIDALVKQVGIDNLPIEPKLKKNMLCYLLEMLYRYHTYKNDIVFLRPLQFHFAKVNNTIKKIKNIKNNIG